VSLLDDIGANYVAPALQHVQGEEITLLPFGGSPVSLRAPVIRMGIQPRDGDQRRSNSEYLAVLIPASVLPSPKENGDQVTCRLRKGDAATATFTVKTVETQEGGIFKLRLN
jgi:hypothetical protein